jgi:hypothetical protein
LNAYRGRWRELIFKGNVPVFAETAFMVKRCVCSAQTEITFTLELRHTTDLLRNGLNQARTWLESTTRSTALVM